jgi:hypothetical protein
MILTGSIRKALEEELRAPRAFGVGRGAARAILLQRTYDHSVRLLYGAAAMSLMLFIVMIALLLATRDHPGVLTALSTVFGTSIAGLIGVMLRISKSVTQAGLLIAIVSSMPREDGLEALKIILHTDKTQEGRSTRNNTMAAMKGTES